MKRFPDYYSIYQMSANYLLPKWGGSPEIMEAFAQDAIRAAPPREAASIYVRIYWNAFVNEFGDQLISSSRINWPLMKIGIADITAHYPDPYNLNTFAHLACLADDRILVAEMFRLTGSETDGGYWINSEAREKCRKWALGE